MMQENVKNSSLKSMVDMWYSKHMTSYTNYLEDTIWCNDRSFYDSSNNGFNPNGEINKEDIEFRGAYNSDNLTCPNKSDRFTVSEKNGNGALTYPVGLVTGVEALLAYSNGSPLSSGYPNWTLSPYDSSDCVIYPIYLNDDVTLSLTLAINRRGVRPSVSLRAGIGYDSGDGSVDNPYVIESEVE